MLYLICLSTKKPICSFMKGWGLGRGLPGVLSSQGLSGTRPRTCQAYMTVLLEVLVGNVTRACWIESVLNKRAPFEWMCSSKAALQILLCIHHSAGVQQMATLDVHCIQYRKTMTNSTSTDGECCLPPADTVWQQKFNLLFCRLLWR